MSGTICGHERKAVRWALQWMHNMGDAVGHEAVQQDLQQMAADSVRISTLTKEDDAVVRDCVDPAMLAKMMAVESNRMGLNVVEHGTGMGAPDFVYVSIDDGHTFAHGGAAPLYCSMSQEQCRSILLKWLDLPDGDSEGAKRALKKRELIP